MRSSRHGYTLIELIAVITLLAMFAALVVPSLVATRDANERQAFLTQLRSLPQAASNSARERNVAVELAYDGEQDELIIQTVADETSEEPTEAQTLRSLRLPVGAQLDDYLVGDEDRSESDWAIRFFPDGKAEAGSVRLSLSDLEYTLSVDATGAGRLIRGTDDQTTPTKWRAGELEQRQ